MELQEVESLVSELETRVDRLRALYEQYFMGIEKLEPQVPRKDVDRRIDQLRREQIRNTGVRFRFQMVLQRYNTYQTYWMRIVRQIENGTFKRHVLRAQAKFGEDTARKLGSVPPPRRSSRPPPMGIAELDDAFAGFEERSDSIEVDFDDLDEPPTKPTPAGTPPQAPPKPLVPRGPETIAGSDGRLWRKGPPNAPAASPAPAPAAVPAAVSPPRPPISAPKPPPLPLRAAPAPAAPPAPAPAQARPPPVPPRPAPRPASPPPEGLPDTRVRQLYTQLVDAKRKQNESTAAITYDALARSLRDSREKLKAKHGRDVDFEVVVKDGKAIIRPVVK